MEKENTSNIFVETTYDPYFHPGYFVNHPMVKTKSENTLPVFQSSNLSPHGLAFFFFLGSLLHQLLYIN